MTHSALRADALNRTNMADQKFATYFAEVPESVDYSEIFVPSFWQHNPNAPAFTVIRLRRVDGDFDVYVTVKAQVPGGLLVEWHGGRTPPGVDPYKVEAAAMEEFAKQRVGPIASDGKPEIRVDHTPRTSWRVIGLGKAEIIRDLKTKVEAEREMNSYLAKIGMRNPTNEELKAAAEAKVEKKTEQDAAKGKAA